MILVTDLNLIHHSYYYALIHPILHIKLNYVANYDSMFLFIQYVLHCKYKVMFLQLHSLGGQGEVTWFSFCHLLLFRANSDIAQVRAKAKQEQAAYQASLRKEQMKVDSLERTLEQKVSQIPHVQSHAVTRGMKSLNLCILLFSRTKRLRS